MEVCGDEGPARQVGGDGAPLDTIQSLTGASVQAAGTLPAGEASAVAAALGGHIFVLGGLSTASGLRTRAIYSISPSSGAVHLAGILPLALSDLAATSNAGEIIAAGGIDAAGVAGASIYAVTVHRG